MLNIDKVKDLYAQYQILHEIAAAAVFKLAVYHKFISDDPELKSWANEAFDDYLVLLEKRPPKIETVKKIRAALNSWRIV